MEEGYIEREAAFKKIKELQKTNPATIGKKQFADGYFLGLDESEIILSQIPDADVAEVKHGEWKWGYGLGGRYGIWCSNCGAGWEDSPNAEWIALEHDYCGKCGAKMDGGQHGKIQS